MSSLHIPGGWYCVGSASENSTQIKRKYFSRDWSFHLSDSGNWSMRDQAVPNGPAISLIKKIGLLFTYYNGADPIAPPSEALDELQRLEETGQDGGWQRYSVIDEPLECSSWIQRARDMVDFDHFVSAHRMVEVLHPSVTVNSQSGMMLATATFVVAASTYFGVDAPSWFPQPRGLVKYSARCAYLGIQEIRLINAFGTFIVYAFPTPIDETRYEHFEYLALRGPLSRVPVLRDITLKIWEHSVAQAKREDIEHENKVIFPENSLSISPQASVYPTFRNWCDLQMAR